MLWRNPRHVWLRHFASLDGWMIRVIKAGPWWQRPLSSPLSSTLCSSPPNIYPSLAEMVLKAGLAKSLGILSSGKAMKNRGQVTLGSSSRGFQVFLSELGKSRDVSLGWNESRRKNSLSLTALTATESAQHGSLSPEGHRDFLWVWKNSHLWAGIAVDGEGVGRAEGGSH